MKKVAASLAITVALFLAVIAWSIPARADVLDEEYKAKTFAVAEKSVKCYVYAKAMGMGRDTLKVYVDLIGDFAMHPDIIFVMGRTTGEINTFGIVNKVRHGSIATARIHAAKHFYRVIGCTINASM